MKRAEVVGWLDRHAPRVANSLRRGRNRGLRFLARDVVAANVRATLEGEPWMIDDLALDGEEVRVRGWALPPVNGARHVRPQFTVNDMDGAETAFQRRADVADKFWHRERSIDSGFAIRFPLQGRPAFPGGYLKVDYVNSPSLLPHGLTRPWHLRDPSLEPALPSRAQRTRAIGNDSEWGFRLSGATDFRRLGNAIQAISGGPLEAYRSVLDWGCGCGRVSRYASSGAGSGDFFGCDIDEENVAWCSANLKGSYHRSSMYPPLPFPDATFDLVYGISVFTHLREKLQDAWLEELRRVIRPGGLLCVTVHGRAAIDYAGLQPNDYVALRDAVDREGIFVIGKNAQLDGAAEDVEEYLNVFHSRSYVRERWSRWFSVRAMLPGYIFTHDLIVLQRDHRLSG